MNVNDFFTQIGEFWQSISFPILFHLIFLTLYSFLFGHVPIKAKLEQYINSESFARTKAILTEFELWTKLPYILLIALLIYLSVFNSVTEVAYSSLPVEFSYSSTDFLKEYPVPEDVIEIAKYGRVPSPHLIDVDNLLARLLEEYKLKYPELYKSNFDSSTKNILSRRLTLFNLSYLTVVLLLGISPGYFPKRSLKSKATLLLRLVSLFLFSLPVLLALRYRAEQAIEQDFLKQVFFVKACLQVDSTRHIIYTSAELPPLVKNLRAELEQPVYDSSLWVSRSVGRSRYLQFILGRRVLHSATGLLYKPVGISNTQKIKIGKAAAHELAAQLGTCRLALEQSQQLVAAKDEIISLLREQV